MLEATALGAAFAAELALGLCASVDDLRRRRTNGAAFVPQITQAQRTSKQQLWESAVKRSLGWADVVEANETVAKEAAQTKDGEEIK